MFVYSVPICFGRRAGTGTVKRCPREEARGGASATPHAWLERCVAAAVGRMTLPLAKAFFALSGSTGETAARLLDACKVLFSAVGARNAPPEFAARKKLAVISEHKENKRKPAAEGGE